MKRTALKRKPRKPRIPLDRGVWAEVCKTGCLMCRAFPVPAALRVGRGEDLRRRQWHHVVGQRHLRRAGLEHLVNDGDNGICLCAYHHERHENAAQRVPRKLLPARALAWIAEHGFEWVLDKEYG